jgi:hypothetical protein
MLTRLKGRGLREKLLRAGGAGDLYDLIMRLEAERDAALAVAARGESGPAQQPPLPALSPKEENARVFGHEMLHLRELGRLITVDFPVSPQVRFGWDKPAHPQLSRRIAADHDRYAATLRTFLPLLPSFAAIPLHPTEDPADPNWINLAFPSADAIALCGLLVLHRPRRLVEIGSGFSTKFARRAIRDHGLPTRIRSIDPEPRAEIDALCDEVVRRPLEHCADDILADITAEDMIFIDGSHRAFQGSDATVFFTEILPALPAGTMFGVHDIFLPFDYPAAWLDWYLSEQYLLACWLLGGERLRIELPMHFVGQTAALHGILEPFWRHPALAGANHHGGAFFARLQEA